MSLIDNVMNNEFYKMMISNVPEDERAAVIESIIKMLEPIDSMQSTVLQYTADESSKDELADIFDKSLSEEEIDKWVTPDKH